MIEEDFLGVGGVGRDITIPWLRIIGIFGLVPLDGWAGNISFCVELRSLHPNFGHRVGGTIFLVCRNVVATDAADIAELLSTPSLLTTCLCR